MARVEGLDDDREADLLSDLDRALERRRDIPLRHGQADVAEDALGVVLVLRDLDADRAGEVGHRRLDAAQVLAESELDERMVVEAAYGNPATARLFDDRG